MSDTLTDKFMGMTKPTFTRFLVGVLLLTFAIHGFTLYRQTQLIGQSQRTHAAVCALRAENVSSLSALTRARASFHPGPGEAHLLDLLIVSRTRTLNALDVLDGGCS